ncbi:MAG: hypothetical protein AB1768_16900 [Pseudomonadota bacterium]
MSLWRTVKRGFGYGLGGRLGWELGGLIWRLIAKSVLWGAAAIGAILFATGGRPF